MVFRGIIHDDHFPRSVRLCEYRFDGAHELICALVGRCYDAEFHTYAMSNIFLIIFFTARRPGTRFALWNQGN